MNVSVGDRLIIEAHHNGEPKRDCQVLEVRGQDGQGPYLVRWEDTGHETVFYPGTDASVQHFDHALQVRPEPTER